MSLFRNREIIMKYKNSIVLLFGLLSYELLYAADQLEGPLDIDFHFTEQDFKDTLTGTEYEYFITQARILDIAKVFRDDCNIIQMRESFFIASIILHMDDNVRKDIIAGAVELMINNKKNNL